MLVGGKGLNDAALDQATDAFIASFNAGVGLFRECYAPALAKNPALAGNFTAKVIIGADARVIDVQLQKVEIADPQLVNCSVAVLHRLSYARPGGEMFGADAIVVFKP